jgi:hypothetical protein
MKLGPQAARRSLIGSSKLDNFCFPRSGSYPQVQREHDNVLFMRFANEDGSLRIVAHSERSIN